MEPVNHPPAAAPGRPLLAAPLAAARDRLDATLHERASVLPKAERAAFVARARRSLPDGIEPLAAVFGADKVEELTARLLDVCRDAVAARDPALRRLDRLREIDPNWHLSHHHVGYVCYVDRFDGRLRDVRQRLDYLAELGVTYLHLMPLLATREGPDDGGYAVSDYRTVDPRLGTMDDLEDVAAELRRRGMSLCVDLVVNHTAREHVWARRAVAGDPRYRAFYRLFEDRAMPDAYEATLPEVFPDTAPGAFSWSDELDAWVWTTFHDYQWDLDHSNPDVFAAMLEVMLFLANRGVEILRLDAVPFMWKRLGTDCQNQPEAHLLLQAWRAFVRMAAPSVLFKAEAIVPPGQLVGYLGAHDLQAPECDLAYNNQLMVMGWSAIAARDAALPTAALARMQHPPPGTTWVTYVRCHDDIGWAVTEEDAAAVGLDGNAHRSFLNAFYSGEFPGSFSRGERFQHDPASGDARMSGMAAALAGISRGRDDSDDVLIDAGVRRLLLLYAIAFGWGGIPLVYMGDEIALDSDVGYATRPDEADDNRWLHRPFMDWDAAERRVDPQSVEGRVFAGMQRLARARAAARPLHGDGRTTPLWTDNAKVLVWHRSHARYGSLLGLANTDDAEQTVAAEALATARIAAPIDLLADGRDPARSGDRVVVPPLAARWLVDP